MGSGRCVDIALVDIAVVDIAVVDMADGCGRR
jgi:hypothetical protein